MAENIQDIKLLIVKYWQGIISLILGLLSLVKVIVDYNHTELSGKTAIVVAISIIIIFLIRFPRIAFKLTRLILGEPKLPILSIFKGPAPYMEGEKLPARQSEVNECWQQIQQQSFFILQGESGSGKSSFVNAALKNKLVGKFRVIECRLRTDPIGRLINTLLQKPYNSEDINDINKLQEAFTIAQNNYSTEINKTDLNKQILLIVDQSEELFVTVKDEIRIQLIESFKKAIARGDIRLMLVIRNDFLDLILTLCRNIDPNQEVFNLGSFSELLPFSENKAKVVLNEILDPLHEGDPIRKQRLSDFSDKLIIELLRPPRDKRVYSGDEKSILPVELQITGMMIEFIGIQEVINKGIGHFGGKLELLRLYIERSKAYVLRKTGVNGERALLILRQLVSPARTKWAQTPQLISKKLNIPEDQVRIVLEAFCDQFLVKRLPVLNNELTVTNNIAALNYELMHEHLVQVLMEAPQPILQKARDAEERLQFWNKRTEENLLKTTKFKSLSDKFRSIYTQPIPISENIALWKFATGTTDRIMLRKNLRGFFVRVLSFTLPITITCLGILFWINSDRYTIEALISKAPVEQLIISTSDNNLLNDWVCALVHNGKFTEAFHIIDNKIQDDGAKSSALARIMFDLSLMNNYPWADSAFTRFIKLKDPWDYGYDNAVIAISRLAIEERTDSALLEKIRNFSDSVRHRDLMVNFTCALLQMGQNLENYTIFNKAFFEVTKIENPFDRNDYLFRFLENQEIKKNQESTKFILNKIIQDSLFLKDPYSYQYLIIINEFGKLNDKARVEEYWQKFALSIDSNSFFSFDLNFPRVIDQIAKNNQIGVISVDQFIGLTNDENLSVLATGLLLSKHYLKADSAISALPSRLKYRAYNAAIDILLNNNLLNEARALFTRSNINTDHYMLLKLKYFDKALELSIKNLRENKGDIWMINQVISAMIDDDKLDCQGINLVDEKLKLNKQLLDSELFYLSTTIIPKRIKLGCESNLDLVFEKTIKTSITDEIFDALINTHQFNKAMELCSKYSNKDHGEWLYTKLAEKMAGFNEVELIDSIMQFVYDKELKSSTYINIITSLADSNRLDNAEIFIKQLTSLHDISSGRGLLAQGHARNGQLKSALRDADLCSDLFDRFSGYVAILQQYAFKINPQIKNQLVNIDEYAYGISDDVY